jgi:tungstate transport system substrate-binding protein
MKRFSALTLVFSLGYFLIMQAVSAQERFVILASTTSTQNSGLFDAILPQFTEQTGIEVRVVAVGTGQALRLARNGDADLLLVHHRSSEERFVAEGYGVARRDVMYNDFVIVGPKQDPADIRGLTDVTTALEKVAATASPFVSRGDDSGTHKKELDVWKEAGIKVTDASGSWYRETGSGMGATLNAANAMGGYTLTDRGTWLSFKNRGELELLVEGDKRLFNPYGVVLVNPAKHPHIKAKEGQQLIDWLTTKTGQTAIAEFRLNGQQLFHPNAS